MIRLAVYRPLLGRTYATQAPNKLNVLFLGRDEFSCQNLQILHDAGHVWRQITVGTTPDQYIGRFRKDLSVSPLKELARRLGLPVIFFPVSEEQWSSWVPPPPFSESGPFNAIITASFGRAIPPSALNLFEPSLRFNVHPSLLPKYRGAAPIQRTIIDGATSTGVSIVRMEDVSEGFDTGPVWGQRVVDIPPRSNYSSLESLLSVEGGKLLVDVLERRLSSELEPTPQDNSLSTRARLITAETSRIVWDKWDADKIDRVCRATAHQRSLHTTVLAGNLSVKLLRVSLPHKGQLWDPIKSGIVLNHPGDACYHPKEKVVVVRCSDSSEIHISELQSENRKALSAKEWWNGVRREWIQNGILKLGTTTRSKL